jgi:hypothetical protein
LSAGWVGASVRARLLLRRRLGRERVAQLARSPSLREAIVGLMPTAYGRKLEPGLDLEAAQRAVAASTLLHLRLLSGWLPPGGADSLRSLAAWYELVNVEDRLAYLQGADLRPPFDLGGLASAWPAASQAVDATELRRALASSAWADPGGTRPDELHLALRMSWANRVMAGVPEVADLVAGGLALLVARELFVTGRPVELMLRRHLPGLGIEWERARTFAELTVALPPRAAWVLAEINAPEQLWQAELAWWRRVETDGRELMLRSHEGRAVVTGAVLQLAVDTWLTASALAAAAAGGVGIEAVLHGET